MTEADIYWTFATAYQHGGGFFQSLAAAGLKADPGNKRRLLDAFPELVATYGTASRMHRQMRSGAAA
jgi:hypothetical protein